MELARLASKQATSKQATSKQASHNQPHGALSGPQSRRGPKIKKKSYHAIRDSFSQLSRQQLFFRRAPTGGKRRFGGILGLDLGKFRFRTFLEMQEDLKTAEAEKKTLGLGGGKNVGWKKIICWLEKKMSVKKLHQPFQGMSRHSLDRKTEKRQRRKKTP